LHIHHISTCTRVILMIQCISKCSYISHLDSLWVHLHYSSWLIVHVTAIMPIISYISVHCKTGIP
jgi:hypothetical protein